MEAALIRLLKAFTTELLSDETDIERIVNNAFDNAEVTITPSAKKELVSHIYYEISKNTELPK